MDAEERKGEERMKQQDKKKKEKTGLWEYSHITLSHKPQWIQILCYYQILWYQEPFQEYLLSWYKKKKNSSNELMLFIV